jgi:hypothetical protein
MSGLLAGDTPQSSIRAGLRRAWRERSEIYPALAVVAFLIAWEAVTEELFAGAIAASMLVPPLVVGFAVGTIGNSRLLAWLGCIDAAAVLFLLLGPETAPLRGYLVAVLMVSYYGVRLVPIVRWPGPLTELVAPRRLRLTQ